MAQTQRLRRSDPRVRDLIARTFPDYTGRRIALRETNRLGLADFWDGGSRTYAVALDLATMRVSAPNAAVHNPMNRGAHTTIEIPDGVAIVERTIYCGQDLGITINVNSATFPRALPAGGAA